MRVSVGVAIFVSLGLGRCLAGDWPKYCANLEMTNAADTLEISRSTIGQLKFDWKLELLGSIASSPSISSGTLYVGDWSGREWAIRASTGTVLATADLGQTVDHGCNPPVMGITSAPAVVDDTIFLAGGDDAFYALNSDDLSLKWRKSLGDNSPAGGYYGWCSPAFFEGRVFQGVSSNCDNPFVPGKVVSFDAGSGEILVEGSLVASGELGAGVWTSPAIDTANRSMFVTTGSASFTYVLHSFSIVRLSIDGLTVLDSWKLSPINGDSDWGSSPTLFFDRNGNKLVGAGQKDGSYYCFRRDGLASGPIWKTKIAIPGGCPQCGQGTLSTAAFDGRRIYVGGGHLPGSTSPTEKGSVVALDPADGHVLWRAVFPSGPIIAPISSSNGIVFAFAGGLVVALDAEDGSLLWKFETGSIGYGGIVIAGGRVFFGDLSGALYAFGVPTQVSPRRPADRLDRAR